MAGIQGMRWGVERESMEENTFKVFVSLPMRGLEVDQIRDRQQEIFSKFAMPNWELMDTVAVDPNAEPGNDLWYLGRSIQMLGNADAIIFANDWRSARGCIVEHLVTTSYSIPALYEE